jgi:hypothetical protein
VSERLGLCSERAIARTTPAIPAPIMAMLRGGEEEAMVIGAVIRSARGEDERERARRRIGSGERFLGIFRY